MKSKRAKKILNRSYDGGHICFENAESAVEIAEADRDAKAVEAFRQLCPLHDGRCLPDCGDCHRMKQFIQKLNEE